MVSARVVATTMPVLCPGGVWAGRPPGLRCLRPRSGSRRARRRRRSGRPRCRQRGEAARAPVDDPLGPVDQPVVVQPLEDRLDGPGQPLVHGEPLAGPVHGVAEAAHLGQDPAAVLALPLPDPLDERLPAEVVPGQALLGELALDDVLGGDAGVVHAGQPQRAVALHAAAADEDVAQRVVQRVADVQDARYVRRREHDRVARRVGVRSRYVVQSLRREVAGLLPVLVTAGFHLGGRVLRGKPVLLACCHIK